MKLKSMSTTIDYILKEEVKLNSSDQTVFRFNYPTLKQKLRMSDGGDMEVFGDPNNPKSSEYKTVIKSGDTINKRIDLVRECLVEIVNLKDEDDKDILWPVGHYSKVGNQQNNILSMLFDYIMELSDAIMPSSKLEDEEAKN